MGFNEIPDYSLIGLLLYVLIPTPERSYLSPIVGLPVLKGFILIPVGLLIHTPDISPYVTLPLLPVTDSVGREDRSGIKSYQSTDRDKVQLTAQGVSLSVWI